MSDTKEKETVETKAEETKDQATPKKKAAPKKKLSKLEKKQEELAALQERRTGYFPVEQFTQKDLKFVKNKMNTAVWKGANEAFVLSTTQYGLQAAMQMYPENVEFDFAKEPIQLQAGVIEAAVYFLNKHEGKGIDSAAKFIGPFFKLQNAMAQFTALDPLIGQLKEEIQEMESKEAKKTDKNASSDTDASKNA